MGKIIGISGKINSGKDLVGTMIQEQSPYHWEIRKFADKLKEVTAIILGCTREDLENREFKESFLGDEWNVKNTKVDNFGFLMEEEITQSLTVRKFLQLLGTECGRNIIHKDIWINALFNDYDDQNWIITDLRFLNEAKYIRSKGGILIRVNRNVREHDHPSETILDDYSDFDYVIINNGSIKELENEVELCLEYLNLENPHFL